MKAVEEKLYLAHLAHTSEHSLNVVRVQSHFPTPFLFSPRMARDVGKADGRIESRKRHGRGARLSGEGAVRLQDGDVRVVEALPVREFRVAVDGVAALHLDDGRSRVGGRAQGVGVVSDAAAELDVVLVPVPPQNRLDLDRKPKNTRGY